MRYDPTKIEKKWQKRWLKEGIYEPDLKRAKRPFYNLMMFPYPSAEGLHIGSVRTFTGIDIYGRFKRMQGFDVFEPIGLDGFGIHSENYALKVGKHPFQHAKDSEKNFYRQLGEIGNGFAWREKLETYDPGYYKWTQWIFTQMFKRGLAYRKKSPVNWCPSCKTVLADEQVLQGECERCQTKVVKKDLEQWFFKITNYAERLLKNLEKIDWPEPIKIAQRNWIGKSEGALIRFPLAGKFNFVFLHAYKGFPQQDFWPWLKGVLERQGARVFAPQLPSPSEPNIEEQVNFLLKNYNFDENTIIVTHSLGGVAAMKLLPKLQLSVAGLIMVAPPIRTEFLDGKKRPALEAACDWQFSFSSVREKAASITVIRDLGDDIVPAAHPKEIAEALGAKLVDVVAQKPHFHSSQEPDILLNLPTNIEVFTTRPDTLFGATYMVLGPEHQLVTSYQLPVTNRKEVDEYIKKAKAKTDEERIAAGKEKTGVELKGIKAINPVNGEEIPIWVADYVLGNVGTGAIMAVPAHDERDFEFAQKYNLPIKMVVCPHYPVKTCPVLDRAYTGEGHLVASGKFDGMASDKARWEITKFIGGEKKVKYRLRDWLISRQRYWGPPIPMIYCPACAKASAGKENAGWQMVPEKDLPVKLPYIKDFRPTGTDKSPLATVEKFYKVRCPRCKSWARRETDVSDTFLDSAWYYLRYSSVEYKKGPWDPAITKKWFPVDMYIGGAEHAVLHLLYVRFVALALQDIGVLHFSAKGGSASGGEEPFKKFRTHGLITKDGAKMSKSKGNVVNPDDYIRAYGSDAIRMYLAFLAPLTQGGDFRDDGIKGLTRFLERIWKLTQGVILRVKPEGSRHVGILRSAQNDLARVIHKTIKKVTEDIEMLQYNTAISALMILLNEFEANPGAVGKKELEIFLKLLAPFAPHVTEELWQAIPISYKLKAKSFRSIHLEPWPKYDPKLIQEDTFELIIQVNGKMRGRVTLPIGASEEEAKEKALGVEGVRRFVIGEPKKIIFVPNRLINFVV